jgi:hypothetical protein
MIAVWLLLALALAYGLTRVAAGYPRPPRAFGFLMRGEAAFLKAAAVATFPPAGAIPISGGDAMISEYVDRLLAASHPRIRVQMRMLFFLVEQATIFFPAPGRGGRRRFSSLDRGQQVAVLDAWGGSPYWQRRLVFSSLRAILTMGYFAHPPLLRYLGVAPLAIDSPICEADLLYPRIGAMPSTIEYTRDDLTPPSAGTPLALDAPLDPRYVAEEA